MTSRAGTSGGPVRKSVWMMMAAAVAIIVGLIVLKIPPRGPNVDSVKLERESASVVGKGTAVETSSVSPASAETPIKSEAHAPVSSSETTKGLIKLLGDIRLASNPLTPKQADKWKQHLEQVIEQGTIAVPVLEEYFQKNENIRFDTGPTNLLGESTLRLALIKVLFDIPTPDNVDLQEKVLQTTTDPEEIALLARQLEQQEPGEHYRSIIQAARRGLQLASAGQLPDRDTTSLVQILEGYGISTK